MLMGTPQGLLDDGGGFLGPDERGGVVVPPVDVATDVLDQGADRVEGTAANRLAGQDAEPGLDHVQPRGAGGSEVEVNPGMGLLPRPDLGRLVGRRVVEDDMQIALVVTTCQDVEEPEEVGSCVALTALPDHSPGGDLKGGIQARQAVAAVVVSLAGWQSRSQWQDRLGPVQGLDLRLLVDAQHHGVGRRVEVQADDIVNLLFGVGIRTELERLDPVRLQVMGAPDPVDRAVGDPDLAGQITRAPVRDPGGRGLERHRDNLGTFAGIDPQGPSRARFVLESGEPLLGKATAKPADLNDRVPAPPRDLSPRDMLCHQQHHASPPRKPGRDGRRALEPLQFRPLILLQHNGSRVVGHAPSVERVYMTSILS